MENSVNQQARHIVITGASAGIGRALALLLAKDGVTLGLIARNAEQLHEVASQCHKLGAMVELAQINVNDAQALIDWVKKFDDAYPIDWFIANAGMTASIGANHDLEPLDEALAVLDTNLTGLMHSVYAALPLLCKRGHGQIGLVSSLAAWRGMALTPAYSASKAGVKAYGEALRDLVAPKGIGVSVIFPGFIETAMSDRFPGPKPSMISATQAAEKIISGMKANSAYIAFPWHFAFGLRILGVLPFQVGSFFLRLLSLQPKN